MSKPLQPLGIFSNPFSIFRNKPIILSNLFPVVMLLGLRPICLKSGDISFRRFQVHVSVLGGRRWGSLRGNCDGERRGSYRSGD